MQRINIVKRMKRFSLTQFRGIPTMRKGAKHKRESIHEAKELYGKRKKRRSTYVRPSVLYQVHQLKFRDVKIQTYVKVKNITNVQF